MTTDRRYNDPALRQALRQEQAAMPHFRLADGWQDAVMKQAKSTSRRLIWTVAAAFVVLFIGAAAIFWQQEADNRGLDIEAGYLGTGMPEVEPPIDVAQSVTTQAEPSSATQITKLTRKSHPRISRQPKQKTNETAEAPAPISLSANRDRMRQAMFEKMNRHSDMTDFEPEIIDEI